MAVKSYPQLEEQIRRAARDFAYPVTPNLAAKLDWGELAYSPRRAKPRRLAWAAAAFVILLAALFSVPPVRARLVEFIQIGAVRIFFAQPTETPTQPTFVVSTATTTARPGPTRTPVLPSDQTFITSVLELDGRTSLVLAQKDFGYPILLPTYPADLGDPDYVFQNGLTPLQQYVVLVWVDEQGEPWLTLYIVAPDAELSKGPLEAVEYTQVNGRPAIWTNGVYMLVVESYHQPVRMIRGHALIWEDADGLTYRLETSLSTEEAIRIAESLK